MESRADLKFSAARSILARLRNAGHSAYLAGGCVRDLLLGICPGDWDITTSAIPDEVLALFPSSFAVGARFGVVLVPAASGDSSHVTEVATFRSDGAYLDGRRPESVRYSQLPEEDVLRRDFTINGLLLDDDAVDWTTVPWATGTVPVTEASFDDQFPSIRNAVMDFVGGLDDLDHGLVRAIGNPDLRFTEDHLRMLRCIRFAARLQFKIESATWQTLSRLSNQIQGVSPERARDEITRMLTEGKARRALELLMDSGLLKVLLPEVAELRGVAQPPEYHPEGDVWTHTLLLLDQLEAGTPKTLAWGALLHDIGKPATFQPPQGPGDRIRFNGHVDVGVAIASGICRRLRFSNADTEQILALVQHHMRFGDAQRMKESTLRRFFRLDRFAEHLALHRLDCRASHGDLRNYDYALDRYEHLSQAVIKPALLLTGGDLIKAGYPPGPQFKSMLSSVEDEQLEGRIQNFTEAMNFIKKEFGDPPRLSSNPVAPAGVAND